MYEYIRVNPTEVERGSHSDQVHIFNLPNLDAIPELLFYPRNWLRLRIDPKRVHTVPNGLLCMCFPGSYNGQITVQWVEDTQFVSIEVPWRRYGTTNLDADLRQVCALATNGDQRPEIELVRARGDIYGHVHLGPCQTLPLILPWLLRAPNETLARMFALKDERDPQARLFGRVLREFNSTLRRNEEPKGDSRERQDFETSDVPFPMLRRTPYRLFYFDGPGGTSPCVQFPEIPDAPPPEASCFQFKLQNPNYHIEYHGVKMYCPNAAKTDPADGKILAPSPDDDPS